MIAPADTFIFDLDGTLVQSVEFDDVLYQEAIVEVIGRDDFDTRWESYTHVTDTGLLIELLARLGVSATNKIISGVRTVYIRKVKAYLETGALCHPMPGAKEALSVLDAAGIKYGVATGGWGETARAKLKYAGIEVPAVLCSSDDSISRTGIMEHCANRLGAQASSVVYFGDAPWDVRAARELNWRFVGVGKRLEETCDAWIADFFDPRWLAALHTTRRSGRLTFQTDCR